jgi:hypothetical protein
LVTGDTKSRAYAATFSKQTPQGQIYQRILWTWNGGDGWRAPDWPRATYRGWSPLNKMYLIAVAPDSAKAAAAQSAELAEFANIFLPLVGRTLYPPTPANAAK